MSAELRALIRDVLREELASAGGRAGAPQARHETVAISSDADLAAFVRRILALGADSRARAEIEGGRHVFHLARGGPAAGVGGNEAHERALPRAGAAPVTCERGLVGEREVRNLPEGTGILRIGRTVRLTPLAQDELRRRRIRIERTGS